MVWSWFGVGLDLVWTWFGLGLDLVYSNTIDISQIAKITIATTKMQENSQDCDQKDSIT